MRRLYTLRVLIVLTFSPLTVASNVSATTIYDTPGNFDVVTALDDVVVSNGAHVTFLPGGSATAPPTSDSFDGPGVLLEANSSLTVAGGTIVGSDRISGSFGTDTGIRGLEADGSTLTISSGSVTGGFGDTAIWLNGADVTVTGGTIAGGVDNQGFGGFALNLNNGNIDISGGDFIGQKTTTLNFFQMSGTISGGSFTTLDQFQILALGAFDTPSTLNITGGEWELDTLISVGDLTTINFFGTGFQIEPIVVFGRQRELLTGTLQDGNDIRFVLNVFGDDAAVNLVPEPTSLVLLSLGGITLITRRRREGSDRH
ncbi:MAG: PEP-CTERM sorting domain-containing protein [Planctomycetota bacterium]